MKRDYKETVLPDNRILHDAYPHWGILLVVGLVFLSPFLSSVPSYVAFVICLFRIVRYDAKVFAIDYCILAPMTQIFCTSNGMSLLLYLVLLAALWHLIRSGIRNTGNYVLLIILMNYLVARMQMNVTQFLLCFGHLCLICVVIPKLDSRTAVRTAKAFCVSLLVSSVFALLFRNTWQLRSVLGKESEAIYNSGIMRFRGLVADPNYYMTFLVMGLALLAKLKEYRWISGWSFLIAGGMMAVFGILTYSKTFVLLLALFVVIYVLWQFYSRKHIRGGLLVLAMVLAVIWLVFAENSPVTVVLNRFAGNHSLSSITTGRTDVYDAYFREILSSAGSFFFGKGMNAQRLFKDPHNLYIEILYYLGFTGLTLIMAFLTIMFKIARREAGRTKQEFFAGKNIGPILLLVLYITLHGIFQMVFYADVFVCIISVMLVPKTTDIADPLLNDREKHL